MASLQELKNTLDSSILSAAAAAEALGLASNAQNEAQVAYDIALAESITNGTLKVMSNVDALLLVERNAGIQGAATFIQNNPSATQAEVIAAWTTAALLATNRSTLLQDPSQLFDLYAEDLKAFGVISDLSWGAVQAWIIATPIAEILAY